MIVITGSAISWMKKNVLKTSGGLYGKVKETIYLKPFDFLETISFLYKSLQANFNLNQCLQYYLFTGGVVRYLEKINPAQNLNENAYKIFHTENNIEKKEFEDFFYSTFENGKYHKELIELFSEKNQFTLEELSKKVNFSFNTLSEVLKDLLYSNILFELPNYGKNKKGKIYSLADLFCYYNVKLIKDNVLNQDLFEKIEVLNGFAFEIFVKQNINLIKQELGKGALKTQQYSWCSDKSKNEEEIFEKAQIDLILDYGKKQFSIIECKNHINLFNIDKHIFNNIFNKLNRFKQYLEKTKKTKKYDLDVVFVTVYGTKNIDGRLNYNEVVLEEVFDRHLKLIS